MLTKGRYQTREATTPADLRTAQTLRARCFGLVTPSDEDRFDAASLHILVEERDSGALVCCFRLLPLRGADLSQSYAAQYYDLTLLHGYTGGMMEMGRFCVHPDWRDPDILRVAWAAMTEQVDRRGVQMLFGCSSFAGVDTARYLDAFALLKARHLAPTQWVPRVKAPDVYRYGARLRRKVDTKRALVQMPPLLRTYLMMGGWVSDHAVVDCQMDTLHVFTGLEVGAIPSGRKRLLRALV